MTGSRQQVELVATRGGGEGGAGEAATERDRRGEGPDGITGPWRSPGGHCCPLTLTQSKMVLQMVLGRGLMWSDSHF